MIFTDMVMPGGMTGFDLAHAALATRPGLKVLFTSGYAEPAIARLGLKAGAWLKKPYTADELAEKVREVLHGSSGLKVPSPAKWQNETLLPSAAHPGDSKTRWRPAGSPDRK